MTKKEEAWEKWKNDFIDDPKEITGEMYICACFMWQAFADAAIEICHNKKQVAYDGYKEQVYDEIADAIEALR